MNQSEQQQQQHTPMPYHILQKPGETLYIPYGIVHSVLNVPEDSDVTIAITKNYGSVANLDLVWKQVCESGDEKKWKILYNLVLNKQQRRHVRQLSWPFTTYSIYLLILIYITSIMFYYIVLLYQILKTSLHYINCV